MSDAGLAATPAHANDPCPLCGSPAAPLAIKDAAAYLGVTRKTIYRWIKAGRIERWIVPSGATRIPVSSLIRLSRNGRGREPSSGMAGPGRVEGAVPAGPVATHGLDRSVHRT